MKLFAHALFANVFQDELVKIGVKFWFERRTTPINIDNLLKFVMNALQKERILIMIVNYHIIIQFFLN